MALSRTVLVPFRRIDQEVVACEMEEDFFVEVRVESECISQFIFICCPALIGILDLLDAKAVPRTALTGASPGV